MRVAVLGVGLIGGSVALAARRRLGAEVVAHDPDPQALEEARRRAAVDRTAADAGAAVAGADLVLVAAPLTRMQDVVAAALQGAGPEAIVTDVGSAKHALADVFRDDERFIGGHPLAGSEQGGIGAAREDLFDGATWYLTPCGTTSGVLYERLHKAIVAIGALPHAIDPDVHDRMMAAVSHLPHVVANVLVQRAVRALDGEAIPRTGPSFRDATRVAGANPPLWAGIYASNRDPLLHELDAMIAALSDVRDRLGRGEDLESWQDAAAQARRALLETGLGGRETEQIEVVVPNRPGIVAELALELGRAGINIVDMSLTPAPDQRTGSVAFWVPAADADRAREVLR